MLVGLGTPGMNSFTGVQFEPCAAFGFPGPVTTVLLTTHALVKGTPFTVKILKVIGVLVGRLLIVVNRSVMVRTSADGRKMLTSTGKLIDSSICTVTHSVGEPFVPCATPSAKMVIPVRRTMYTI